MPRVLWFSGSAQDQHVGLGQHVGDPLGRPERFHVRRLVNREHVGGQNPRLEGGQKLGQPAAHAAQADDAHRAPRQIAGRPANELLLLLGVEKDGQTAAPRGHQGDGVLGHLVGQHARGAGHGNLRLDDRGQQAMVHAGGRGLDPLESSLSDDGVPVDGHLGMAAENVGLEDFLGDALLAGVDDLGLGRRGGDLPDVFRLDGIAKDDAHHKSQGVFIP